MTATDPSRSHILPRTLPDADATVARTVERAIAIQQIPAPTFHEEARARRAAEWFQHLQLADVETDAAGNVYARLPGRSGPAVVVSAHLDTVFPPGAELTLRREPGRVFGPGIGDNSVSVAALATLAELMELYRPPSAGTDVWLVANVCEEGLGNLRGMHAVMDRLGELAGATVVLEGHGLGRLCHRGLGSRRIRLTVRGPGGHSWRDFGQPSAVHVLVALAERLTRLTVPDQPRTTFNIGTISGGQSVNSVAARAQAELDLRSEDPAHLAGLIEQVERICRQFDPAGTELRVEVIGDRPSGELPRTHWLVRQAQAVLSAVGLVVHEQVSSTDANVPLAQGQPAVCIGLTRGGDVHRLGEWIEIAPLATGVHQAGLLIARAAGHLAER